MIIAWPPPTSYFSRHDVALFNGLGRDRVSFRILNTVGVGCVLEDRSFVLHFSGSRKSNVMSSDRSD